MRIIFLNIHADSASSANQIFYLFQEEVLPDDVATEVAQNEKLIDGMPGVLVKGEDGSLKKIVTPGVQMPLPDFKPEPTR